MSVCDDGLATGFSRAIMECGTFYGGGERGVARLGGARRIRTRPLSLGVSDCGPVRRLDFVFFLILGGFL